MGKISEVIQVTVTRETKPFKRAGFGIPLILGTHTRFQDRVKYYSDPSEMLTDGFVEADLEYKAALDISKQDFVVKTFGVGRRDAASVAQVDTITPVVQDEATYSVKINATTFSFVSDASATAQEIVAGLLALVNAGTEPVTASGTATLILTADVAGVPFTTVVSSNLTVVHTTPNQSSNIGDTIEAIINTGLTGDNWFGLILTSRTVEDIVAAAAKCETLDKVFLGVSSSNDMKNGVLDAATNPGYALKLAEYLHSGVMFSTDADHFVNAAILGQQFTKNPGSSNYDYKTCVSCTPELDSVLTTTVKTNLKAVKVGWYETMADRGVTRQIKTGADEWMDVVVFMLWLKAKIAEAIFEFLTENEKVDFTDEGIAGVIDKIEEVLRLGVVNHGLAKSEDYPEGYTITYPKESEVTTEEKALRVLNGIEVFGNLAGAVNEVGVLVKVAV
jgi:hypothetical protein